MLAYHISIHETLDGVYVGNNLNALKEVDFCDPLLAEWDESHVQLMVPSCLMCISFVSFRHAAHAWIVCFVTRIINVVVVDSGDNCPTLNVWHELEWQVTQLSWKILLREAQRGLKACFGILHGNNCVFKWLFVFFKHYLKCLAVNSHVLSGLFWIMHFLDMLAISCT